MQGWIFPGQGAQRRGMGGEVLARFPELVAAADRLLGLSVVELCSTDPGNRLRDTRYAQPALFVVEALSVLAARADGAPPPALLAGHSLGEYTALFAAGCFDFETGVRLLRRRGELMARSGPGGMCAVIGPTAERLAGILARYGAHSLDIANHNSATQTVLAGPADELAEVARRLRADGLARTVPLAVSAPFHSRYMRFAAAEFREFLAGVPLRPPAVPVIANTTAEPYGADGAAVAELLTRQIAEPVRWAECMARLRELGVTEVTELGPGGTLTGLWREAASGHRAGSGAVPDAVAASTGTSLLKTGPDIESESTAQPSAGPSVPAAGPSVSAAPPRVRAENLGCPEFRRDYRVRAAYLAGSMYRGISSTDLVLRMGRAGLLGFFGTGGLPLERIEQAVALLARESGDERPYGVNLLHTPGDPAREDALVSLLLRYGVRCVEAAGFTRITPALVRLRYHGASRDARGRPVAGRHVVAKVSRPEVAEAFLAPAPAPLLERLVAAGALTAEEAAIAGELPVSGDLCVESDSGGHTDGGVALALLPSIARLRDAAGAGRRYPQRIRVGAAGGLGTPEAVAAAFLLGADFVLTGSVNQCSREAGTAPEVKEMLAGLDVQDTTYAPAGDMFELGARVQVVRKGTMFPARANRLYQLYRSHESLEGLDGATRRSLEEQCFGRPIDEVWQETAERLRRSDPEELARAERSPRHRMALVFRWYFAHSTRLAMRGEPEGRINYQIHCGPAMGAFNRFVAGTELADWRRRHVDVIADRLMAGAAEVLTDRLLAMTRAQN
ncbi:ACP S-malonyltransferase [Kitasatospora cystarginea]|uniref:[acyl-carrier-protein] S-malonyltransferase n=1 Tax=Kitasatospora cystarginea TaxID=58350 RepID=A0ABN3ERA5_9ACTN